MANLLEMRAITRIFPGVKALDQVSLSVREGEIHAICGENGAGKSTLMKVLSGVSPAGSYTGDILFDGQRMQFRSIRDSEARGIIIIHPEPALVPQLSIAENLFLGNERATGGVIRWTETLRQAGALLKKVGLHEAPNTEVGSLSAGKQQLIGIARALAKNARLLILDEPTAALSESDSQALLDLLLGLKSQGVTPILISHRLNEVKRVADRVTVLRDGSLISVLDATAGEITEERILRDMLGRDMAHRYPARLRHTGKTLFELKNWNVWHPEHRDRQVIRNVSLHVRAGEVLGIAGLTGAGRTELAMSIFGRSYGRNISGEVYIRGRLADTSDVPRAIRAGLAYVPGDRKSQGLIMDETIRANTSLANLRAVSRAGVLDSGRETEVAEQYRKALRIRTPSVFQQVGNLSGGNQQKVVLARWLFTNPDVLILDEPTRGTDVGAKYDICSIINDLAAQGKAVVMISSGMPELLGMCDRICVMNEGRIAGELDAHEASEARIMSLIVTDRDRDRPLQARITTGRGSEQPAP